MSLLLDTHIWLWSVLESRRLAPAVAQALEEPNVQLWLSPASVWETLIAAEKGRLALEPDPLAWTEEWLRRVPMREATFNHEVALETHRIALPHRDPIDRLLVATARVYGLTLVTSDARILGSGAVATLANA